MGISRIISTFRPKRSLPRPDHAKVLGPENTVFGQESCFGQTLDDGFEKDIKVLGELWVKVGISVTPKAHANFAHVAQFLNFNNPQPGQGPRRGLGYWSEHTGESVHHDFEMHWQSGYKRPISLSEDYKVQGLLCISTYAAKHA